MPQKYNNKVYFWCFLLWESDVEIREWSSNWLLLHVAYGLVFDK